MCSENNINNTMQEIIKANEEQKRIISQICVDINKMYGLIKKVFETNITLINDKVEFKYISAYTMVFAGYGIEICRLQELGWNNSVQALSRDLLECYAIVKKLIYYYWKGTKEFKEYINLLICEDMEQDRKIYKSLGSDSTIADISKRDKDRASILTRFKTIITERFPTEIKNIRENNLEKSLLSIVYNLYKKYQSKFKDDSDKDKTKRVGWAIEHNNAFASINDGKPYESSHTIYRSVCHFTHASFSSVEERAINSGYAMLNTRSKNDIPSLNLDFYCMKDIYNELKKLFG